MEESKPTSVELDQSATPTEETVTNENTKPIEIDGDPQPLPESVQKRLESYKNPAPRTLFDFAGAESNTDWERGG